MKVIIKQPGKEPEVAEIENTLPALQHDKRNPSDTANTPHELTHAPDALRGYAATVYEPVKAVPQSAYDCEVGEFLRF